MSEPTPNVPDPQDSPADSAERAMQGHTYDGILRRSAASLDPLTRFATVRFGFQSDSVAHSALPHSLHVIFEDIVLSEEFREWSGIGIVVQAYLRDGPGDVARLRNLAQLRGTPITVPLVKGAYWDEERIVARQEGHAVPVFEEGPGEKGAV